MQFGASAVHADPIALVPYDTLEPRLATRVDFEEFPRALSPGTVLDGPVRVEGATLGERFRGQRLSQADGFDRLTPAADPPLTLVAGAAGQNLAVSMIFMLSNHLAGLAPPGYPAEEAGGEGAVAILFDHDQFALGFRVAADPEPATPAPPGRIEIQFFRRDATPIAGLTVTLARGRAAYGFLRAGEIADIAGIAITNSDPAGIAIDDLIFDVHLALGQLMLNAP